MRNPRLSAMLAVTAVLFTHVITSPAAPDGAVRRLALKEYRDKMKAGWLGQMAGVTWGAPTEFKFQNRIIPVEKVPEWKPATINDCFSQDDLYVEMTFLRTLEQYGLDVSIRQAGLGLLEHFASRSTSSFSSFSFVST